MSTSTITSTSNSRIKDARKLQRRRERHIQQRVLIEGLRLVRDAWQAGATFHHLFYTPETLAAQNSALALVDEMTAAGIETLPCSLSVFATLSETVTPQGIAATVELPQLSVAPARMVTLLLDQVRDPGNAGTLLRSAAAAGADLTVFGPETVDPFNEKVMRAGMGAHFRTPLRTVDRWDDLPAWIDGDLPIYLAEAAGVTNYDAVDWTKPATLVVGGEAHGASEWVRTRAMTIAIPMARGTESLNAAVAASVMLFEAARQRRQSSERAATLQSR